MGFSPVMLRLEARLVGFSPTNLLVSGLRPGEERKETSMNKYVYTYVNVYIYACGGC